MVLLRIPATPSPKPVMQWRQVQVESICVDYGGI